jgi:DNA (cytosine-5)-methyltransferase 1
MKHLGDITKINGKTASPVNVIIGGSPCQDLSIAGKRQGLSGERSGLFMEQIRIIKEMREKYGRDYPRFMVWENVPGAFSSNSGEDFRAVLEKTAHVADETAVIPEPPKGKWRTSGCIMGDGWNIAWRVLDAQYFGVPQRRRRIALVADFGGSSAPEILFERESLSEDSETRGATRGETAGDITECIGISNRGRITGKVSETLRAESHGALPTVVYDISQRRDAIREYENTSNTLSKMMETGGNNVPICFGISSKASNAMKSDNPHSGIYKAETARTLDGNGGNPSCNQGGIAVVARGIGRDAFNQGKNAKFAPTFEEELQPPLVAKGPAAVQTGYTVRRLTPLECERLQGLPDGWTDIGEWTDSKGRKHRDADSPRYRALGNGIALPPWRFVLGRLAAHLPKGATMASLFDGIGSFPLIWQELGNKTVWQSEIDEFCEAVTKLRFSED